MEILELHGATLQGLTLGSHLVIPEGTAGVVVKDSKPLDVLPPGDHLLESSLLPLTLQKLKIKPGALPTGPLPAAVFLVQTQSPFTVPWRCQAILSKNVKSGLTYTTLEGRTTVQVTDPGRFCGTVLGGAGPELSSGALTPAQAVTKVLAGNLQALAADAVPKLNILPEQAASAQEAIRTNVGHAAAGWLASAGLHCTAFDLDAVAAPRRTPCVVCKSATAPTGYALFQRNISLFYVRYTAKKEGNFCVPCALKTAGAYNGVMLVIGWWGLLGLIFAPIYFAQNLYYLTRILTGPKLASTADQAAGGG
ncbi:MAG: SPFH domain-containing protein [Janthinobacterium lividum]